MLWEIRKLLPVFLPIMVNVGLRMSDIPVVPWLGDSLIGLSVLLLAYYIYDTVVRKRLAKIDKNEQREVIPPAKVKTGKVLQIKQQEPRNQPPIIFKITLIICSFIILIFSGWTIFLWIERGKAPPFSLALVGFFLLFIALPICILFDIFTNWRKRYKTHNRFAHADKTIILCGDDLNKVFERCLRVLGTMKATGIDMDRPKLCKGHLENWIIGGSRITVRINQMKDERVKIHVSSVNIWRTVIIDFGINQRNVDKFSDLLRLE